MWPQPRYGQSARASIWRRPAQSEADEKRGREIRRREERLAKLERDYEKQLDDCEDGDRRACDDARDTYAEMQQIIPSIPYEPEED